MNAAEQLAAIMKPKNKYHAHGFRDRDGDWWDSGAEYQYWLKLVDRERHGEITLLERQWEVEIIPAFVDTWGRRHPARSIRVDFRYVETSTGFIFAEDCKGMVTRDAALRWELAQSLYSERKDMRWRLIDSKTLAPVGTRTVA